MKILNKTKQDSEVTSSDIQTGIEHLANSYKDEITKKHPIREPVDILVYYHLIGCLIKYLEAKCYEFLQSLIPSKKGAPSERKSSSVKSRFGFVKNSSSK